MGGGLWLVGFRSRRWCLGAIEIFEGGCGVLAAYVLPVRALVLVGLSPSLSSALWSAPLVGLHFRVPAGMCLLLEAMRAGLASPADERPACENSEFSKRLEVGIAILHQFGATEVSSLYGAQ